MINFKAVILAMWEAEIRRTKVQGQLGQKVLGAPSQPVVGCSGTHLSSSAMQGSTNKRITVQTEWETLFQK
jgi:hypothetical protein